MQRNQISEIDSDKDRNHQIMVSKSLFTIEKLLGRGSYGKVFLVRDQFGQKFAMKTMEAMDSSQGLNVLYLREVAILKEVDHPGIVKLRTWHYSWKSRPLIVSGPAAAVLRVLGRESAGPAQGPQVPQPGPAEARDQEALPPDGGRRGPPAQKPHFSQRLEDLEHFVREGQPLGEGGRLRLHEALQRPLPKLFEQNK